MKALAKIGLVIIVAVLANIGSCSVLVSNLKAGVYSPDADTLTIPIFENAVVSSVVVLFLVGCAVCNRGGKLPTSLSLCFGFLAVLLSALLALKWAVPNHFVIAALFGGLSAVSILLAYFPLRRLASNNSLKSDAAEPRALG